MNTEKLTEALDDLKAQRGVLDTAIAGIENALKLLGGQEYRSVSVTVPLTGVQANASIGSSGTSYIDYAEVFLREAKKPLHVTELTRMISDRKGKKVQRASVESSFIRHIEKSKEPRLAKSAPSTYGLPEWKDRQPMLAHIA